jgi:hypothetical protein
MIALASVGENGENSVVNGENSVVNGVDGVGGQSSLSLSNKIIQRTTLF